MPFFLWNNKSVIFIQTRENDGAGTKFYFYFSELTWPVLDIPANVGSFEIKIIRVTPTGFTLSIKLC